MLAPRAFVSALAAIGGVLALVACSGAGGGDGSPTSPGGADPATSAPGPAGTTTKPGGAVAGLDCGGHGCGVRQLALGIISACALLEDGTVACYGGGIVGTLGRTDRPEVDPTPKRVPGLSNVAAIFGGGYSMCALLVDRTVSCWGPDQSASPYGARPSERFVVEGLANVVDLAVAISHTCALVEGGEVLCFGSNYFGELGDGSLDNAKRPVKVAGLGGVKRIATGAELSCAVLGDGSVSCWGLNDQGQLGQGDADKLIHPAPTAVPGLGGPARDITASSIAGTVCALLESGATRCWGEKLAGDTGVTGRASVALGGNHACGLDAEGAVACWGANNKGQLGNASNQPITAPTTPAGVRGAKALVTGGNSSCVVLGEGSFACWGDDSRGQLGGGKAGPGAIVASPVSRHF